MKEGWEVKKLNEICEIRPSKRQVKEKLLEEDLVTYAPMADLGIDQKYFSGSEEKLMGDAYKGYTYFEEGDVILAKITPCFENGKLGIANDLKNGVGFGSTEFIPYRTSDQLLPEYLYYYLNRPTFRKEGERLMTGAVGHQRIPKDFYEKYEIPVPPLNEQKRIVSILDNAFKSLDKAKENIDQNVENARELLQSSRDNIFSNHDWQEKKLGDITYVKSGGTPRRSNKQYWENGKIPWYSSGELNDIFTKKSERFITGKGLDESTAKLFPKGSLLIGMYDTAALKMSILDRDATFNQAISGVKPNENLNLQFVMHAINSKRTKLLKQRRGVRQKNLNLTKIKAISVPFPKVETQNEVVGRLGKLKDFTDKLIATYQEKNNALEIFKKSILEKAFSGKLIQKEFVA